MQYKISVNAIQNKCECITQLPPSIAIMAAFVNLTVTAVEKLNIYIRCPIAMHVLNFLSWPSMSSSTAGAIITV